MKSRKAFHSAFQIFSKHLNLFRRLFLRLLKPRHLGPSMVVQYRTWWTGYCEPKRAKAGRVLAFVPRAPIGALEIQVTVPAGMGPGQQLRVQTPQGIQLITIPDSFSEHQTFTFRPEIEAKAQIQP